MKATELMVGDWVNFLVDTVGGETREDPMTNEYQPMQIVGLDVFDAWGNNDGDVESAEGVINDIDQVKPIPLTMELIEKNGLSQLYTDFYDFDMFEFNDGLFRAIYSNCEFSDIPDESVLISYVHELQHFLRHLKIDKEVEI